jgi:2',3'-cyclic-nucleotide 2'-phosphodiesterase (5'-nucleotidase family)
MVAIDSTWDATPNAEATALLAPYKAEIGKVMYRVLGTSAISMEKGRPESLLSNWVADILKLSAQSVLGKPADIGLVNIGGLRANMAAGPITVETIYEICPFENSLCVLTMKGSELMRFFAEVARLGGTGISGVTLRITKDGKLLSALVGGKPVDENHSYTIGTIDYLAEGNDGLPSLLNAEKRQCPDDGVLRDLVIRYVEQQTAEGKIITSRMEGRITVEE